jgi:hypothetical protein
MCAYHVRDKIGEQPVFSGVVDRQVEFAVANQKPHRIARRERLRLQRIFETFDVIRGQAKRRV